MKKASASGETMAASMPPQPGVRFDSISKRFGSFGALQGVTFEVLRGEVGCLLGPAGSGKSTLLRILAGLTQPDEGRVWIGEVDVTDLPPQRRNVGLVFQHALFKHMSLHENVAFGLTVLKLSKPEVDERVMELLELVRLQDKAHMFPAQLSGGERLRVNLARALAPNPDVMLLDEPFAGTETSVRAELNEWVQRLRSQLPITALFVTRDQDEAMQFADRVVVIHEGQVRQVGTPREIYGDPASKFVAAFVGPINRVKVKDTEHFIRPSDVIISIEGSKPNATVEKVTFLGDSLKVHAKLKDGQEVVALIPLAEATGLELSTRMQVRVDFRAKTVGGEQVAR